MIKGMPLSVLTQWAPSWHSRTFRHARGNYVRPLHFSCFHFLDVNSRTDRTGSDILEPTANLLMGSPPTPAPSRRVSPNDTRRYIIAQTTMWGKRGQGKGGKRRAGAEGGDGRETSQRVCIVGREANAMDT